MTLAEVGAVAVIVASSTFLFIYGMNLLYLSWRALQLPAMGGARAETKPEPAVLVQLPIYNERNVAARVIDACARLEWPRERLEIQVLDDSDDDTPEIVAEAIARWAGAGIAISHVRRGSRQGYKAGALAHGLSLSSTPLVAVFDADFVPPPEILHRLVPLLADQRVAFAQARWGHLNENFSLFARLQGLMADFHFLVEQPARADRGYLINFTGSAGIWRRAAIDDAGGWSATTLTEDLDLSYRAQLRGWKAAYSEVIVVPQELPVSVNAYRGQQSRWATGSFQCAAKLLAPVWRSHLPQTVKFQATMHLLGYVAPLAMMLQTACYPVLLLAVASGHSLPGTPVPLIASGLSLAPAVGMAVAQSRQGREWWRQSLGFLGWSVLGAGTSLTVAVSLWRALRGGGEFKRTPKYQIERLGQDWRSNVYFKRGDVGALFELGFGLAAAVLSGAALAYRQPLLAVYAGLFAAGFLYLALLSFVQALRMVRYETVALRLRGLVARLWAPGMLSGVGLILLITAQLPDPFEDSYQHWLIAANLVSTGRLQDPLFQMQDTWLPAYHLLAALVLKIFGLWQLGALKLVNAGFGLITLALVYRLAESRRQGLLAMALLGLNPVFLLTTTTAVAEPLLVVFLLAAVAARRHVWLAALLAGLACLTGTKAWLWLGCVVVVVLWEALRNRRSTAVPRLAWVAPALVLAVALQAIFGFGSHSVARAAQEAGSAAARGSLPASPLVRLGQFVGFFAVASPLLVGLAPFGIRGSRLSTRLYLPSVLYLGLVTALVSAGIYSGSHRYYYPALPGLALLAAGVAARLRMPAALIPVGGAAVVALGFLPVFTGLAADNRGLSQAGVAVARLPGGLVTDSPAAAYWSHKPPGEIYGSRALPSDPAAALPWMSSHGVGGLVLENIDYYRARMVLPGLVSGKESGPFILVGDQSSFNVPGGKEVHVYGLAPLRASVASNISVGLEPGSMPHRGKTAPLAKGLLLFQGGRDLTGEGMGFGVPIARYDDGWHYPGEATTVDLSTPGNTVWRETFDLNQVGGDQAHGYRFQPAASVGRIQVTYRLVPGGVKIEVRRLTLAPGLRQVALLNEQAAAFDDFAAEGATKIGPALGNWEAIPGTWARLRSQSLGVEWVQEVAGNSKFQAGRESAPPDFDWSGLDYVFDSRFSAVDYQVLIQKTPSNEGSHR
jgi:cellulose synthase/poly-beta-1,6-N-acetylglucosamine synthase-like glycosyltransferase